MGWGRHGDSRRSRAALPVKEGRKGESTCLEDARDRGLIVSSCRRLRAMLRAMRSHSALLPLVGVGFWVGKQMVKKKERRLDKMLAATLVGNIDFDTAVCILPQPHDSWVHFPEAETLKWFSDLVDKLWYHIDAATHKTVIDMVAQNLPPEGNISLEVLELTLGSVAPELSINASDNLSSMDVDADGMITLDVGFKWAGDPNIIILLKSNGIPLLPAQLKTFQLYGTLRVVLGPLTGKLPILSAMTFTFVDPPKVKFNLSIMGASVTFISPQIIFGLLNKLIYNLLVWPSMTMVTIMGDKWDYPELLVTPVGTLFVNVRSAKLKRASDLLTGTADPYVVLGLQGEEDQRTPAKFGTLAPTWDDHVYALTVSNVDMQNLRISVFDQDLASRIQLKQDALIGLVQGGLSLNVVVESQMPVEVTADLVQHSSGHTVRAAGVVNLELFYLPFPGVKTARKPLPKSPEWKAVIGTPTYILIWVHQANNLILPPERENTDAHGFAEDGEVVQCDPYVIIRLYKEGTNKVVRAQAFKSAMVKGSKNPRFGAPYAKFRDTGLDVRTLDLEIEIVNAYQPPGSNLKKLHSTLHGCIPKKFEIRDAAKASKKMAKKAGKSAKLISSSLTSLDANGLLELGVGTKLQSLGKFRKSLHALLVSPLLHHRGGTPLKEYHWVCPGEGTDVDGNPTVGVGLYDIPGQDKDSPLYRRPIHLRPNVKFNLKWSQAVGPDEG